MTFKLLLDKIHNPILVYDGCEPKRIIYKLKDKRGKNVCAIDLWANATRSWRKSLSKADIIALDEMLRFPRKRLVEEDEIVAHIKDGPVYLARCLDRKGQYEFFVYFTLFELQPSRYQCFVLAVIQKQREGC